MILLFTLSMILLADGPEAVDVPKRRIVTVEAVTEAERLRIWELAIEHDALPGPFLGRPERLKRVAFAMRREDKRLWPVGVIDQVLHEPRPKDEDEKNLDQIRQEEIAASKERMRARELRIAAGDVKGSFDPIGQRNLLWWKGAFVDQGHGRLLLGHREGTDKEAADGILGCEIMVRPVSPFVEAKAGDGTPVALLIGDADPVILGYARRELTGEYGSVPWERVTLVLQADVVAKIVDSLAGVEHGYIAFRFGSIEVPVDDLRRQAMAHFWKKATALVPDSPSQPPVPVLLPPPLASE